MTARTPQLIVSLTAQGNLTCELPEVQGTRRRIELRLDEAGHTLLRILEGQAREGAEIGLDGAPTKAQVRHWKRHQIWASIQCRFCLAEGRTQATVPRRRHWDITKRADGVEIRVKRAAEGTTGEAQAKASTKTAEELGL